jgi:hypothetical protein
LMWNLGGGVEIVPTPKLGFRIDVVNGILHSGNDKNYPVSIQFGATYRFWFKGYTPLPRP